MMYKRQDLGPIMTPVILEMRSLPFHHSPGKHTSARESSVVREQHGSKSQDAGAGLPGLSATPPGPSHAAGGCSAGGESWRPPPQASSRLNTPLMVWSTLWRQHGRELRLTWFLQVEKGVKWSSLRSPEKTGPLPVYFTESWLTCLHLPFPLSRSFLSFLNRCGFHFFNCDCKFTGPLRCLSAPTWSRAAAGSFGTPPPHRVSSAHVYFIFRIDVNFLRAGRDTVVPFVFNNSSWHLFSVYSVVTLPSALPHVITLATL